jgi:hypothetical protein
MKIRSTPFRVGAGSRLITRAETKDVDFDSLLSGLADKVIPSENVRILCAPLCRTAGLYPGSLARPYVLVTV